MNAAANGASPAPLWEVAYSWIEKRQKQRWQSELRKATVMKQIKQRGVEMEAQRESGDKGRAWTLVERKSGKKAE